MLCKPMLRLYLILASLFVAASAAAEPPAKEIFSAIPLPADLAPRPIGFYSRGCMAGGVQLPPDGPYWQAMRLSRNRQWGQPVLIDYLEKLGRDAARQDGWPGLLVGDMSQPRGGPMATGHASHQTGLDVDIWLVPMPARRLTAQEREDMSAVSIAEPGPHEVHAERWTPTLGRFIRRAALDPRVERIFVAPGIKKKLCETAGSDRAWLRRVRPYYGHDDHLHVRLGCPAGTPCRAQSPPPQGDGCGSDLAYWFTEKPYRPAPKPAKPPKPMTLADLPATCRDVVAAEATPGTMTMVEAFRSGVRGIAVASAAAPATAATTAEETVGETARLPRPRPAGY
jgi:penicillin-insensitive murein endopeptidase